MAEISRLPGPVADLWDWQLHGLCRRENPDVFFHPEGERGVLGWARVTLPPTLDAPVRGTAPRTSH